MSDGDSIAGAVGDALKDLGREAVKQIAGTGTSSIKAAASQLGKTVSPEEEAKKKAEQIKTFQRVKEIEAEMKQIAAQNAQKTGPEIPKNENRDELQTQDKNKTSIDEASRQALGRAEQGRNFKG